MMANDKLSDHPHEHDDRKLWKLWKPPTHMMNKTPTSFLKQGMCSFPDSFRVVDENMEAQKQAERNAQSFHKGRQLLGGKKKTKKPDLAKYNAHTQNKNV